MTAWHMGRPQRRRDRRGLRQLHAPPAENASSFWDRGAMRLQRVLLADDHRLLVEAFRALLEPHYEVVGTVFDGHALLETAPLLHPDVVVLDIAMPLLNGLDAGRQLKEKMPEVKLVFLTMSQDFDLAAQAMEAGASAYVLKSSASSELFHAIKEALKGRFYVTKQIARGMQNPSFAILVKRNAP